MLLLSPQKKSEIMACLPKRRENASCVYTELSVYVSFESQNKDMLYYNNNIKKSMCVHFLNIHFGSEVSWLAQKKRKSFHATSFTHVCEPGSPSLKEIKKCLNIFFIWSFSKCDQVHHL